MDYPAVWTASRPPDTGSLGRLAGTVLAQHATTDADLDDQERDVHDLALLAPNLAAARDTAKQGHWQSQRYLEHLAVRVYGYRPSVV
ncbi:hypothetical protein [Streptomyces sp. NPDC048272]|uniref:hypothetical protein n=1 Tax=Streptomyces sp. NPDC048272 TaxID=3154616 RepID=UPI003413FA1A